MTMNPDENLVIPSDPPWLDVGTNMATCCQCRQQVYFPAVSAEGWKTFFTKSPTEQEHPEIFCAKCAADWVPWGCC